MVTEPISSSFWKTEAFVLISVQCLPLSFCNLLKFSVNYACYARKLLFVVSESKPDGNQRDSCLASAETLEKKIYLVAVSSCYGNRAVCNKITALFISVVYMKGEGFIVYIKRFMKYIHFGLKAHHAHVLQKEQQAFHFQLEEEEGHHLLSWEYLLLQHFPFRF